MQFLLVCVASLVANSNNQNLRRDLELVRLGSDKNLEATMTEIISDKYTI